MNVLSSPFFDRTPNSRRLSASRDSRSRNTGIRIPVAARLDGAQLRRLAEFRFQLRCFLHVSQAAAESMGLPNQQYQLLQCVGGMPESMAPTIANVALRMLLKHNSAVELVDRAIEQGLLQRSSDDADHRRILLRVTPMGERVLASLADFHTRELEQSGPELVKALNRILHASAKNRLRNGIAAKRLKVAVQ